MQGIDITGQRFGRLVAIKLIPKKERTWSNKERAWLCKCDCGKETIVRQRNLLGKRVTKSCGCLRKVDAFLATSGLKDLDEEYLLSFDDFDKFLFIHKSIRRIIRITEISLEQYKNYIDTFYNDKQFNFIYNFWKTKERENTFYDMAKPSIDHKIPISRGGNNDIQNLQFLTIFENLCKRDMTEQEWLLFKNKTNTKSEYFIENILKEGDAI